MAFKLHRKMLISSCLILACVSGSVFPDYCHLWGTRGWTHQAAGVWVCIDILLFGLVVAFAGGHSKDGILKRGDSWLIDTG